MKFDKYLKHVPTCATTKDHEAECTCGLKEFEMYVLNLETMRENNLEHIRYCALVLSDPLSITPEMRDTHRELLRHSKYFNQLIIEFKDKFESHGK